MASSTALSFFSSPTATIYNQNLHLSKPKLSFSFNPNPICSFPSSQRLSFSPPTPLTSRSSAVSFIARYSESEAPVLEAEAPALEAELESEPTQIVESAKDKSKPEGLFAVVMVGGRQYIVHPGRFLVTQRLKGANVNDKVLLNKVLLVATKTSAYIGKPIVPNAVVHAVVEDQGLNDKVRVFKYKKKKNYRRNIGHRQPNTRIRITAISGYEDSPVVTLDSIPK